MTTRDAKRTTGLIDKFRVERTDGKSAPGQKHHGCRYFVLDLDHDPHAIPAIEAYAKSARTDYPALAADLDKIWKCACGKRAGHRGACFFTRSEDRP